MFSEIVWSWRQVVYAEKQANPRPTRERLRDDLPEPAIEDDEVLVQCSYDYSGFVEYVHSKPAGLARLS